MLNHHKKVVFIETEDLKSNTETKHKVNIFTRDKDFKANFWKSYSKNPYKSKEHENEETTPKDTKTENKSQICEPKGTT